ncbi:MAG TPA: L,D-transpeptidase [Firmicutes bacterium]|nr:L,D-transpeptidase [Bacillota bacterium]
MKLTASSTRIEINRSALRLIFILNGAQWRTYPCALGKPSTPTPAGNWKIREKIVNPSWEVLGTRWMGLDIPAGNYGIHGTNAPWSIGSYISNGCIRLHNEHIEEIFPLVSIGTPVKPRLRVAPTTKFDAQTRVLLAQACQKLTQVFPRNQA